MNTQTIRSIDDKLNSDADMAVLMLGTLGIDGVMAWVKAKPRSVYTVLAFAGSNVLNLGQFGGIVNAIVSVPKTEILKFLWDGHTGSVYQQGGIVDDGLGQARPGGVSKEAFADSVRRASLPWSDPNNNSSDGTC